MSHIAIISEEKLFAEALADAVSRELGAEVTVLESQKTLSFVPDLLVTTISPSPRQEGQILRYSASAPRKITSILSDIAECLTEKNPSHFMLSELIMLQEKNKKLERLDNGQAQELTEKEQALLLFIKDQGEVAREDILKSVWGFAPDITTSTLETHIYRLRQKWRELADYDCILATDKGYRWYE